MAAGDYYDTLGLHPDTNKVDPGAEKKFQEVQKAY
ncbi:hypothetical protein CsSME_00049587 [Camellia sinensis var. sinensis]